MELATAIKLIEKGITSREKQTWADLGAGGGLFTNALSTLLPKGSSVIAIDRKPGKITVAEGIQLEIEAGDFTELPALVFNTNARLDGVLMANALHYVKDQQDFLKKLSTKTKQLIIVEYNNDNANTWVPYPISFVKLRSFYSAELLAKAPSQYSSEGMYSALISF